MIVSMGNVCNVIHIDRKIMNHQKIDKSIPFLTDFLSVLKTLDGLSR